jgi:hypothetical protein
MFTRFIAIVLFLAPAMGWAVGDECVNEHNENLKQLCLAKEHASAGYCDKITSMGTKMECILTVRNKQREITWTIKPIDMTKVVGLK